MTDVRNKLRAYAPEFLAVIEGLQRRCDELDARVALLNEKYDARDQVQALVRAASRVVADHGSMERWDVARIWELRAALKPFEQPSAAPEHRPFAYEDGKLKCATPNCKACALEDGAFG